MIGVTFDYASPSAMVSERDRALLGFSADARRPVRFHGRIQAQLPLVRFALRALGEVIWSRDEWVSDEEWTWSVLDPVITVHPDRIFFEAFSGDQSAYAALLLDPALFATDGEIRTGTTNVDFTAWLWGALGELRSSRETWLRIDPGGFAVETKNAGGRFEPKVDVPESWVRGFLQIQAAMTLPGTRLSVRPVDLLSAIRFLRYTKARVSPRALRYEFFPGQDARIVLEPWEHPVPLRGATHGYMEPRIVRTWGRRRLKLIEPLLPFAERVDIYLKGRGLPSFYAVKLPGMTFLLGLSGWSAQRWTGAGSFDLLGGATKATPDVVESVRRFLAEHYKATEKELAETLTQPAPMIHAALTQLCRLGRAIYDVESRAFRHRELFAEPIDEAKLYPPDPRSEQAAAFLAANDLMIESCDPQETRKVRKLKTPDGVVVREIVYRDWRVTGRVGQSKGVEIVIDDNGRVIFGKCPCAFFQENLLGRGPCEHMITLFRASEPQRGDLPSSFASNEEKLAAAKPKRSEDDEAESGEEDDETSTEDDSDVDGAGEGRKK
jgi:hypothetical protein